jgi:hypothetical protein
LASNSGGPSLILDGIYGGQSGTEGGFPQVILSLNPYSCNTDENEKHFFLLLIAGIVKNYTNESIHIHYYLESYVYFLAVARSV